MRVVLRRVGEATAVVGLSPSQAKVGVARIAAKLGQVSVGAGSMNAASVAVQALSVAPKVGRLGPV